MRTGKEYLESLGDGRNVYVGGELIEDIRTHPKTKGYAHAIAEYYDRHLDTQNQQSPIDALVLAAIQRRCSSAPQVL
jgi:aromatic ring hydroxylase